MFIFQQISPKNLEINMKKSYYNKIKKEDMSISLFQARSTQNNKNDDDLDTKILPLFSQPVSFDNKFQIKPKVTAKLFIGDKSIPKTLIEDSFVIQRVKKHLDQEYLEKYRNKYIFNPSPPHPAIEEKPQNRTINMTLNASSLNHKISKYSKNTKTESLFQSSKIASQRDKKTTRQNQANEPDTKNDDLPIALRRTKRPTTKPLRYWLGEKIMYKIDKETGCYTKAFEITIDQDKNSIEKKEFIVKNNSIKSDIAYNSGKHFLVKDGEIYITINDKLFKASPGCKIYLPKGQKVTFENKTDNNIIIAII